MTSANRYYDICIRRCFLLVQEGVARWPGIMVLFEKHLMRDFIKVYQPLKSRAPQNVIAMGRKLKSLSLRLCSPDI